MSDVESIEQEENIEKSTEETKGITFQAQMPHPVVLFLLICILISSGMLLGKILIHYETFTQNALLKGMNDYGLEDCVCNLRSTKELVSVHDGVIMRQPHRFSNIDLNEIELDDLGE